MLQPNINFPDGIIKNDIETSRTYKIDFENKRISGKIDGVEAIKQLIHKIFLTDRFRYLIYSGQHGNEINKLKGQGFSEALIRSELPRLVTEALMVESRILKVYNLSFEFIDDELYIRFDVDSTEGKVTMEEVI